MTGQQNQDEDTDSDSSDDWKVSRKCHANQLEASRVAAGVFVVLRVYIDSRM